MDERTPSSARNTAHPIQRISREQTSLENNNWGSAGQGDRANSPLPHTKQRLQRSHVTWLTGLSNPKGSRGKFSSREANSQGHVNGTAWPQARAACFTLGRPITAGGLVRLPKTEEMERMEPSIHGKPQLHPTQRDPVHPSTPPTCPRRFPPFTQGSGSLGSQLSRAASHILQASKARPTCFPPPFSTLWHFEASFNPKATAVTGVGRTSCIATC